MAKPRIGALDKRIIIEAATSEVSASGAASVSFAAISSAPRVWAKIEPMPGGGELDEAGRLQPRSFWKVTIRRRADLTRSHRVKYGDRALYIRDITDTDFRSPFIDLVCTEYPA